MYYCAQFVPCLFVSNSIFLFFLFVFGSLLLLCYRDLSDVCLVKRGGINSRCC